MSKDLAIITSKLDGIDISKIVDYSNKVKEISNLSAGASSLYLQEFIVAFDLASSALSIAMRCEAEAKTALDEARAEAYFDRAGAYLEEKRIKETSEARKKFEDIDPAVIKAKDVYSRSEASVALFKNKVMMFRYAYEAIKKVYYSGNNDSMPFEGM